MTPDVNLLVAASRSDHPHYAASRAWLEQSLVMAAAGTSLILMIFQDESNYGIF